MTTDIPAIPLESRQEITKRAAAFFERRHFGRWSDTDQAELETWFAESTLNRVAYLRLECAVTHTERLIALRPPGPGRSVPGRIAELMNRRIAIPLLLAASFVLLATVGWPFLASLMRPADRVDSTDIGGRTLLSFADHTQIELNTDTAVRVRMTTAERTVWLEKGEAWFHVAHDAAHPFNVIIGRHRITDLGTEFLVRRDANNLEVALLNGRAALSAGGMQTATLKPGDDAVATPVSLTVTRKTPQELADELAWRRGMLVFRNTRLSEVVRQFNRYNATKLVIADPTIAGETITADIKTDDFESFLRLAEVTFNLRADREGSVIMISRAPRGSMKRAEHARDSQSLP